MCVTSAGKTNTRAYRLRLRTFLFSHYLGQNQHRIKLMLNVFQSREN